MQFWKNMHIFTNNAIVIILLQWNAVFHTLNTMLTDTKMQQR